MELDIAREVIYEWNAVHTLEQKRVLLPLSADDTASADILIAIFCATQGTPEKSSSRSIELAIEKQIESLSPVLIYFSEGRVDLKGIDFHEACALNEFKKRFEARALLDSFSDEKEFRAHFARQLELVVSSHSRFRVGTPAVAPVPVEALQVPSAKELSDEARTLLSEACDDPEAYIGRHKDANGLKLQANGRQFVPKGDAAAMNLWEKAFEELISHAYIQDAGCKGKLFQISREGFEYLKGIGKTPVGYIAELGGM